MREFGKNFKTVRKHLYELQQKNIVENRCYENVRVFSLFSQLFEKYIKLHPISSQNPFMVLMIWINSLLEIFILCVQKKKNKKYSYCKTNTFFDYSESKIISRYTTYLDTFIWIRFTLDTYNFLWSFTNLSE